MTRIVTGTEFGNIETRNATARDLERLADEQAKRDAEAARLGALRADYAAIRREALALGARADMSDVSGCPLWRALLTAQDFDRACVAHAMRAIFDTSPQCWDAQQGRSRWPSEYLTAARSILALAHEDAENDRRTQSR